MIKMSKTFEENVKTLEEIVKALEADNSNLDASMKAFEKGIKLYNSCNDLLKNAENKIEILNEKNEK
jgi:exodeoxyribonuclease VII small subunit